MAAAFTNITESVGRVTGLVTEASEARRRQARGIEQVSMALAQMESVTQTTAANAEDGAAASEEPSARAACPQGLVDDLRALEVDRTAAAHAARRRARLVLTCRGVPARAAGAICTRACSSP